MINYFTTGQVARKLRVSISTLKRWLAQPDINIRDSRNCNGWRLFTEEDITSIKKYKKDVKKNGKRFNKTTLIPMVSTDKNDNL